MGDKTLKSSLSYGKCSMSYLGTERKFHFQIVYFAGYSCLSGRNMHMPAPGAFESAPASWRLQALEKGEMSGKVEQKGEPTSLG